jgi:hypothetical protein
LHPLVLFEISTTYNVGLYQNKGPHEAKLSACLNSVKLIVERFLVNFKRKENVEFIRKVMKYV